MPIEHDPLSAARPIVSTAGIEGESELRRFRRECVADVLLRYISQTTEQSVTLIDIPVVEDARVDARWQLLARAVKTFSELPSARLVVCHDQLTLENHDLLGHLLETKTEVRWPEAVLSSHRDIIGGSRGARVRFARSDGGGDIEVFTTRPDTLYGLSFVAVSPSHPAAKLAEPTQLQAFRAECAAARDDPNAKIGVPLGISVSHPFVSGLDVPVWLANFVVEGYGSGAAGGCPACDQRDLEFARRYGLPIRSIICPPGMPSEVFQVGASAHEGDGIIINSSFLSGLPVSDAKEAAIERLVELGRGEPTIQYRLRRLVVAESASESEGDVHYLEKSWRFSNSFLRACAAVPECTAPALRPHMVHVTGPEAATRHLLDSRILFRALGEGRGFVRHEPWDEIVFVNDVIGFPIERIPDAFTRAHDVLRLALLVDTPPDRDMEWSDQRGAGALRLVEDALRVLTSARKAREVDKAYVAGRWVKAIAMLEAALRRRKLHNAVAAVREILGTSIEIAEADGLDTSARMFLASTLYPVLPGVASEALASLGFHSRHAPTWPDTATAGNSSALIEVIVQVNGKKRGTVRVARDADEHALIAAISADETLNAHVCERSIRKTVVVPNRLVNLVI